MKKLVLTVVLSSFYAMNTINSHELSDCKNTKVIEMNTEPLRTSFRHFSGIDLFVKKESLSNYQLLKGYSKFNWTSKPDDRSVDFYQEDYDASTRNSIPVASGWLMKGYGYPIYANIIYSLPINALNISHENNLAGSYKRKFTIHETNTLMVF